jgi:hypothetical protein
MASLLRLQALSLTLASPRRLPSRILRSASPSSPLARRLSAAAASPEQRASETVLTLSPVDAARSSLMFYLCSVESEACVGIGVCVASAHLFMNALGLCSQLLQDNMVT